MKEVKDRTGEKIGRLTIIRRADDRFDSRGKSRIYWLCECECGTIKEVRGDSLNGNHTVSCGCFHKDQVSKAHIETRASQNTYGESRERIHNIWYLMKYRCEDPTSPAYHNYGGRGIKLCEEWADEVQGYFRFKEWALNNGYDETLTIDRIDNNGNYSPENCRWADDYIQRNNRRNNIQIEYGGRVQTLSQWARELGVPMKNLHNRIRVLGWDVERAFTQPYRKSNRNIVV